MNTLTILIYPASSGGYLFDIYTADLETVVRDCNPADGGLCTGSLQDAIGMAAEQSASLAVREATCGQRCLHVAEDEDDWL